MAGLSAFVHRSGSTLRRESGSVVDAELRESQSDLLFSARLHGGEPVLLYLLLEHQSTVDRWMVLRMLQYVAEVYATPEGLEELRAVVHYLLEVGDPQAGQGVRQVLHSVAGEKRAEEWMKTMGQTLREEGRREGRAKGQAEGRAQERAEGVLRILEARGITVDERSRRLVLECADLDTLDRWFKRAVSATRLSELW